MNKVTVTKAQMEAVVAQRDLHAKGLNNVIHSLINNARFHSENSPLSDMSLEQVVLTWHGHVKVSPNYVSFDEAKKALGDGKHVICEFKDKKYEHYMFDGVVFSRNMLRNTGTLIEWYDIWDQIFLGEWSIVGDNQ